MTPLCAPFIVWPEDGDDGGDESIPGYTSDLVVKEDSPFLCFGDLREKVFAYNDDISLSGYICLKIWMHRRGIETTPAAPFFSKGIRTGGHHQSMEHVLDGKADCAVIDRVTRICIMKTFPGKFDGLRILKDVNIGAMPSQPVCCSQRLPAEQKLKIQKAFLKISDPSLLRPLQFKRYGAVDEGNYKELEASIKSSENVALY